MYYIAGVPRGTASYPDIKDMIAIKGPRSLCIITTRVINRDARVIKTLKSAVT